MMLCMRSCTCPCDKHGTWAQLGRDAELRSMQLAMRLAMAAGHSSTADTARRAPRIGMSLVMSSCLHNAHWNACQSSTIPGWCTYCHAVMSPQQLAGQMQQQIEIFASTVSKGLTHNRMANWNMSAAGPHLHHMPAHLAGLKTNKHSKHHCIARPATQEFKFAQN